MKFLLLLLLLPLQAFGMDVTVAWDPIQDPSCVGYIVYYGPHARDYTESRSVGASFTEITLTDLDINSDYYIAVAGIDADGLVGDLSEEIAIPYQLPPPHNVQVK